MIPEQELKERCTPGFIKWMIGLAEGFDFDSSRMIQINKKIYTLSSIKDDILVFPLFIRRAVDGWNKKMLEIGTSISIWNDRLIMGFSTNSLKKNIKYLFSDYQPQLLAQSECAMLHCLLEIFAEEMV